jgi:hypothetical protein
MKLSGEVGKGGIEKRRAIGFWRMGSYGLIIILNERQLGV